MIQPIGTEITVSDFTACEITAVWFYRDVILLRCDFTAVWNYRGVILPRCEITAMWFYRGTFYRGMNVWKFNFVLQNYSSIANLT